MKQSKWEQRIRRADELTTTYPFAAEVLQFYRKIAELQQAIYSSIKSAGNGTRQALGSLPGEPDLDLLLPMFPEFLKGVEQAAPQLLAESAAALCARGSSQWQGLLTSHWRVAPRFRSIAGDSEGLLAWLFVQPYAESLADSGGPVTSNEQDSLCPFCAAKPLVGVLRPEGDGAKRSLICSLCATEWTFGRIVCPACGEQATEKLAIYTASQFQEVRVEACDTCRCYIKTVDLSKNGRAVPVVDELATIPLNLWAEEHQYVKLQPNLLGV
jgi:FdhE protein